MANSRKRNPLSKLSVLTDAQADAVFEFGEAHTLEVTCKHLADEYDVEISKDGLSKWLNRERADRNFEVQLSRIATADERAGKIGGLAGKSAKLTGANIALLQAALQAALLAEDALQISECSKSLAAVLSAHTGERRADIAADAAALNRDKFEVESCERFLAWSNDERARGIVESSVPNAEKIAALRKTFFADVDAMQASGKVVLPE